jgi:hypothetical protein
MTRYQALHHLARLLPLGGLLLTAALRAPAGAAAPSCLGAPGYGSPSASSTPPPVTATQTTPASSASSPSGSPSALPSIMPSPSGGPVPSFTPFPARAVIINEVAWAGTSASPHDEWIELYNTTAQRIQLQGWTLCDGGDINIALQGTLPGNGFYLLERTDDTTVADIPADRLYTGSLANGGETLFLRDPGGALIDTANSQTGPWPAGDASTHASMQRVGAADLPGSWLTYAGFGGNGHAADGSPIAGTPHQPNVFTAATPTALPTGTTPAPTATPHPPGALLISEVAWAGTLASAGDEWIEIYNPGEEQLQLSGWSLSDGGDIWIQLCGIIAPHGFFLLERIHDQAVADIPADQLFHGALRNSGEPLSLRDPGGALIDVVNAEGGPWPAGSLVARTSMERRAAGTGSAAWASFTGWHGSGHDAEGNPIPGTPRSTNSIYLPIPTPTPIPGRLVINEVLIRPHYDWNRDGQANLGDEFIELFNLGPGPVTLAGWMLDDRRNSGSKPFTLPDVQIQPGGFAAFFRAQTHIALNDSGDLVRLLTPDGRVADRILYLRVRAYNLCFGRLPDGSSNLTYGLWPTPHRQNLLFEESLTNDASSSVAMGSPGCPPGMLLRPLLPRLARHAALLRWLAAMGLAPCSP